MKHKHLSQEERYYIEISLKKGDSQNTIAKALDRSQGTISKELKETVEVKDTDISKLMV